MNELEELIKAIWYPGEKGFTENIFRSRHIFPIFKLNLRLKGVGKVTREKMSKQIESFTLTWIAYIPSNRLLKPA